MHNRSCSLQKVASQSQVRRDKAASESPQTEVVGGHRKELRWVEHGVSWLDGVEEKRVLVWADHGVQETWFCIVSGSQNDSIASISQGG